MVSLPNNVHLKIEYPKGPWRLILEIFTTCLTSPDKFDKFEKQAFSQTIDEFQTNGIQKKTNPRANWVFTDEN